MYKDKFKQWKWSKNMTKSLASKTLSDNQRRPTYNNAGRNDRTWPMRRVKSRMSLSSLRASGEDSLREGKPPIQDMQLSMFLRLKHTLTPGVCKKTA